MLENILDVGGSDLIWKGKPILPAANEENRKLDETLKNKKIEVETLKAVLEKNIDKGKKMRQHFSDVCQTLNYKQQLYKSREHELEIEEHAQKILERECSRLSQQIKTIKQEIETFKKRKEAREAAIAVQKTKQEKLKSAIKWDETALMQYLEDSAQLEKDNVALLKYTTEDDSKIKELALLVERLSNDAYEKKNALDDADTEVFIVQSELDRMQEEFRNAHQERKDLITNWEKVMNQIQQRNDEMKKLSECLVKMKTEETELKLKLKEQMRFLSIESARNNELQIEIKERDNYATKLRNQATEETTQEKDLKAELETTRNVSNNLLYQKQLVQNAIKQLEEHIKQKTEKLEQVKKDASNLEKDIDTLIRETFNADHYIKELENLLQRETNNLFHMEKDYSSLEQEIIVCYQEMKNIKSKEKVMEAQKKGCEASMRNLNSKVASVDSSRIKQIIAMQEVESSLEKIRSRVKKMSGETNEEEKQRIDGEKARLLSILSEKNTVLNFLSEEVKTMMEKVNVSVKALESSKKTNIELSEKISFIEFYITNSQKALKNSISRKQELLVQECLAKFQMQRFQRLLSNKNKSVLSLQKSKAEFETMMKERVEELNSCQDMLQIEIRVEHEECSKVMRKLQECSDKVLKLQTKYKVLMDSLGADESAETSQAELLIQAENEKRAMQVERDELMTVLLKNEEELNALQNTVWLIKASNEQFRKAIYPPGMNAEHSEKLGNLEIEGQSFAIEIHALKQRLYGLENKIQEKETELSHLQQESQKLRDKSRKVEAENEAIDKEISDVESKLNRAKNNNSRLCIDVANKDGEVNIEEDINIRLLREIRKTVSESLFSAVESEPLIHARVLDFYDERKVPMPSRAKSSRSASSTSGSRVSSRMSNPRSISSCSKSSEKSSSATVLTPSIVSLGSTDPEK